MTLAHLSASAAIRFPKSAAEYATTVAPSSKRRAFTCGSARPSCTYAADRVLRLAQTGVTRPTPTHAAATRLRRRPPDGLAPRAAGEHRANGRGSRPDAPAAPHPPLTSPHGRLCLHHEAAN